jgi:hypothetical protein
MRLNPIRRSQLVAPFGPGALHVLEGGVAVVTGCLDHWFKDWNGNSADPLEIAKGPLLVREPRLEGPLGVSHFRMAPGPENRGDVDDPELHTPVFRFPSWYVCPGCKRMKRAKLTQAGYLTCDNVKCKKHRLRQVSFAAVCDHGHLQDFPWLEWVHRDEGTFASCANSLIYEAEGSGSLESIRVKCEACDKARSLAGVMSGEFPKNSTDKGWSGLSRELLRKAAGAKTDEFSCRGHKPWQGPVPPDLCDRPLRAVLINATNVHYADVRSAIHIPPRYQPSASRLATLLDEADFRNRIAICRRAEDDIEDIVKKLRKWDSKLDAPRLTEYEDDAIESALRGHDEAPPSNSEAQHLPSGTRGEQEERIRRDEFKAFQGETDREGRLVLRHMDTSSMLGQMAGLVDRVVAIEKLRETRVFAGFSRLMGTPPPGAPSFSHLLWHKFPRDASNRWLPAAVVHGEGIFITFNENSLQDWEKNIAVRKHLEPLQKNHDDCVKRYNWEERQIAPRFVLLHTLAHLLINRLVFECGYGSAALRERLYVSTQKGDEMAGILIYTAAGDSEGTMGGLVRLADPDILGRILDNCLEEAQWCSADPVCAEAADSGGQGPDSLNLAACHSCALLPETSCECFNKYLDRMLVVDSRISILSNL